MKYLKYAIGLIIILAILFIGKGFLTPTVFYENEILVNKPAKESWAVMTDEATMEKWIEGFKKTELISGTVNTVGAVSNVYVVDNGQEMVMKETIKSITPNEHIAMTFSMDFMDMEYEMFFNETDGKTKIQSKSTTTGNGIIAKSMISFMPDAMKQQEDENLVKLKKLIEENTKNYFPEKVIDTAIVDSTIVREVVTE